MAQFKYNGSDERVFPTISVTVNAGEIFDAPDDFDAPDVSPSTQQSKETAGDK